MDCPRFSTEFAVHLNGDLCGHAHQSFRISNRFGKHNLSKMLNLSENVTDPKGTMRKSVLVGHDHVITKVHAKKLIAKPDSFTPPSYATG